MLIQTHFFFALAIAYILKFPVKTTAFAGALADIDTVFIASGSAFPFVHRGFMHTPIILGILLIAAYFATRKPEICAGFGAGFLTHLLLDTFNPTGIMWLYPLTTTFFTLNLATYSNVIANWGIVAWSLAFILIFNPSFITKINPRRLGIIFKGK
ncbi:MAG: metal-dependent hydrolase [Candidatus Aenigmarchaeota archaeon]|nr:metal-dependent hydrolase [Candidatus Aenigmarchaeota archaeon]